MLRAVRQVARLSSRGRGLPGQLPRAEIPARRQLAVQASPRFMVSPRYLAGALAAFGGGVAAFAVSPSYKESAKELARDYLPKGPHHYKVSTPVRKLKPGEDREMAMKEVYEVLRFHAAPGGTGTQVSETGTEIDVTVFGKVTSIANPADLSVTNQTQPTHLLHDGKVVRRVVIHGDSIEIESVGTGDGICAWLNEAGSKVLWSHIDKQIGAKFK